jgi:glutamate N-acetyltransferase/amino-acid N-acetyltransferase
MPNITRLAGPHITLVPGFSAAGVSCGLKKDGALDLALIYADVPSTAAAMFTTNRIQAAPVIYDRQLIQAGRPAQAIVINSGNANACTGEQGMQDVKHMAEQAGTALDISPDRVWVMSTGVIGQPLPMDKIDAGIVAASRSLSRTGGHDAARAIMTTDTRPKEAAVQIRVGDRVATIAGMCKGAGMIHPDMATLLVLLATDAAVEQGILQNALADAVNHSFNMITVDGDTSTNDTVLLLASGQAGNRPIGSTMTEDYEVFVAGLCDVATGLAQSVVRDGEGASKFITIRVRGAPGFAAAKQVAKSIANSALVKTAIYGQDANWGRVICAAGYSGIDLDPDHLCLWMRGGSDALQLVKDGAPFEIDEPRAAAILKETNVTLELDLGLGEAEATVWTCDLTHSYVDINAHYRT